MAKPSKDSFLRTLVCSNDWETKARENGYALISGTDSVGDGSLWGPVTAASCILRWPDPGVKGLRDSKLVSAAKRIRLADEIRQCAVSWAVSSVSAEVIDKIGIRKASEMAMYESIHALDVTPDFLLVDGVPIDISIPQASINHGDALSFSIAAASIVAKVERNALVTEMSAAYPGYALDRHFGYGPEAHMKVLETLGPTPLHRFSFAPIKRLCRVA
ncbi:MAG: ribonuclease HII [Edaphobacter sp.]